MHLMPCEDSGPDREFLAIAETLVLRALENSRAQELFLVEIDNWFGFKWRNFTGKNLVPMWLQPVRVPAFHPHRIVTEKYFVRGGNGELKEQVITKPLHSRVKHAYLPQAQPQIARLSRSAVFAWYSRQAKANRAASLMIYIAIDGDVSTWYAGFKYTDRWLVDKTQGIERDRVDGWLQEGLLAC